jgi:hypothetical protein
VCVCVCERQIVNVSERVCVFAYVREREKEAGHKTGTKRGVTSRPSRFLKRLFPSTLVITSQMH